MGSSIKPEFSIPDNLLTVEIDEGQINQVVSNLTLNAIQAMPEGGFLKVSVRNKVIGKQDNPPLPDGNSLDITIQDHGIGIETECSKVSNNIAT